MHLCMYVRENAEKSLTPHTSKNVGDETSVSPPPPHFLVKLKIFQYDILCVFVNI